MNEQFNNQNASAQFPPPPQNPPPPLQYPPPQFPQSPEAYMKQGNPPGQTMVKVVGILMIVFGSIFLFYGVDEEIGEYIIYSAVMLTAGILGTVFSKKKEKMSVIMIAGVVAVIAAIIVSIASTRIYMQDEDNEGMGDFFASITVDVAFYGVLPILMTVGANKRRNSQD
jgi:uncharacterized membrane protein HdeD (DUF308 family)